MRRNFILLALLLIAAFLVVLFTREAPVAAAKGREQAVRKVVERELAAPSAVDPGQRQPSPAPEPEADQPVAAAAEPFVRKVISSEWIDPVEKEAGRRRVRIVRADFKYPKLRLEESVLTDPQTGEETVTQIRASVADHLMVGLAPGTDIAAARRVLGENGFRIRSVEPDSFILAELTGFEAADAQPDAIRKIAGLDEFISFAEPDWIVYPCLAPNDPDYSSGKMWGLHNPGTAAGSKQDADIDAPEAWQVRSGAPGIVVAVTDTGIQYNHEDLRDNMWSHPDTGSHGFDAYDDDDDPMDIGGHGTHCAGTIGAVGNNGTGMSGVAWEVQLMGVRFLGPNGGSTSDGIRSVNYARLNGAHIISASWGGGGFSQSLFNAIQACQQAGIPFVAAAGNSSTNNDSTPHYPSSYNLPNIVSVASTTIGDTLSPFSCYGKYSVDIGAPGSSIWSTYIGSNNAYKHLNGTSMATPHVSGAMALAMAQFPSENSAKIIARLYDSADRIPALTGKVSSNGRLNLHGLLTGASTPKDNDNFADAFRFGDFYGFWSGSSEDASKEADEDTFSVPGSGIHSLWFAFRTPHGGLVTLDAYSNISGYRMIVFEGSQKGSLKLIHDFPNGSFTLQTIHTFNAKPDTEYRVAFDDRQPTGQMYALRYSISPPNDFFSAATAVSGDAFSAEGTNRGSTQESFEQQRPHAGLGRGKSVWWRWTAPEDMDFTINTMGSGFDTVLAVYTGGNTRDLIEIASNDDRNALDWTSQVGFQAIAGTTYHIAVDGYRDDASGEILLNGFRSGQLTIIRQPQDLSVEIGKRAVFDVSVLSGGDPLYQWFLNDAAIPGQTSANLVIDPVGAGDFGNYKVEVRNSENIVTSGIATLAEKQTPPGLTWSSGNQAVASGTAVTLAANFSGTSPITYAWTKNGEPFPGDSTSLNFPSAQVADAGAYRLTATNTAGTANADFTLSVVQSPWERWEWRRPGIPNAAITDIKVYGGEAFAVSGTMLFRSSDGETWSKSVFPQGFTANSIAKAGGIFVCLGTDQDNQFRIATSANNAVTWAVSAPTGFSAAFDPQKFILITYGSAFIAHSPSGQDFLRSTNGTSWARITATNLAGQTVDLTGNGRIATNGSTLILASKTAGNNRMRYFKSTNGTTWAEHETDATGADNQSNAVYALGKFHMFDYFYIYTSIDGTNWISQEAHGNGLGDQSLYASNGQSLFAFKEGTQSIHYYSSLGDPKSRTLYPANSHLFTAAASFGDKVLYGTDKGLLGLATDPNDVRIPREKSSTLQSIEFTENLFIARTTNPSHTTFAVSDQVSGDGKTWKESTLLDSFTTIPVGYASGKYWGHRTSMEATHVGYNPFDARLNPNEDIGLQRKVYFVGELPDGSALATNMGTNGTTFNPQIRIQTRDAGSGTWVPATFPIALYASSKFVSLGNRWFSNIGAATEFGGATSALIYTSTDGKSWASTGLTGSNPYFITFAGKSWCFLQNSASPYATTAAHSTNGTSWTPVAITGIPSNSNRKFAKRVVTFGDYLVLLGGDENLYFSENGTTWLRGFTPDKVVDIAVGNGGLVAVMKNGGIIQTGSAHPGVNAPQVSILSPQPSSTHLVGSRILIEGTVSDPEEGIANYQGYVDDKLVASGTGRTFRFHITTSDLNGHTITVRASDSHGLRQIDAIRIRVALPEPENLMANREGGAHIPHAFAANFDGVFYVAGTRSVFRSIDGKSWQNVPMPSFTNPISGMASGNGALVIQFDNGGIITTRDGINWTHFQPNHADYRLRDPLRFSSGVFIATYTTSNGGGSVMTSEDGLRWETGAPSFQNLSPDWSANNNVGTIIGADRTYGVSRTFDRGYNWFPIPEIPFNFFHNTHGIFADGKFIVAIADSMNGYYKLFVSEDAYDWEGYPLPAGILHTPALGHHGGLFFLGQATDYSRVSADGVTWSPMSHAVNRRKLAHLKGVFVAQAANGGVVSSQDGINWQAIPFQGMPSTVSQVLTNEDTFLVIDSTGGTWSSPDGVTWVGQLPGATLSNVSTSLGRSLAEINGTLVVAGARLFVASTDNGRSWVNTTVNGQPPSTVNTYHKVVSSDSVMLALEGLPSSANTLHRSTNGTAFTTVTGLPAKTWDGLATNGSEWMLLARDGSLFRSIDGGLTWTQVAITGMVRGGAVAWLNGRWVIIGTEASSGSSPYIGYTLGEGDALQKHGNIFPTSSSLLQTLVGHGKLIAWQSGRSPAISGDGVTWLTADLWPGGSSPSYDIYQTAEGFASFGGTSYEATPPIIWYAGTDGVSWQQAYSPFKGVLFAEHIGQRVFLFSSGGGIAELHDKDLALTLPSLPAVTRGVGDEISANITISNFGRAIPPGGAWKVTAWLAKNRFYGDTKNIPIGTFDITTPMPAPGASVEHDVTFTLPNEILTGDNFLILSLSGADDLVESNTANNTVISDTAAINIPEWEFAVATNGNGQVNRDFSAARYPHKAQVSLTANAGKGAAFTGWAGDANSPNNQITILMDGNKSLQANFSNRANLQVFVRGLGEVTGRADLGTYNVGSTAQLGSQPAEGWVFSHWSGAANTDQPAASILMDAPKSVTAHFIQTRAAWRSSQFSEQQLLDPEITADDADPDGDGIPNWKERHHGSRATDRNSTGIISVELDAQFLRCIYTRNTGVAGQAPLVCQAGRGMNDWSSPELEERILSTGNGIETVEARFPRAGHERGFIRFKYVPEAP